MTDWIKYKTKKKILPKKPCVSVPKSLRGITLSRETEIIAKRVDIFYKKKIDETIVAVIPNNEFGSYPVIPRAKSPAGGSITCVGAIRNIKIPAGVYETKSIMINRVKGIQFSFAHTVTEKKTPIKKKTRGRSWIQDVKYLDVS